MTGANVPCPRCGTTLRGQNSVGAMLGGGLLGVLIKGATNDPLCPRCGPIPRASLSPDALARIKAYYTFRIIGVAVVLVALVGLWIYVFTTIRR